MQILVFDDNQINQASAREQLKDHDLTVVGTYDEAQKLLKPEFDYSKASELLRSSFGEFDKARAPEYFAAKKMAREQATTYPTFDVVLSDLLVPASKQSQGWASMELVGKEMPVGIFIGLLAAVRARAKYVAVFTDTDHHSHPASACFDSFPTTFTVEGAKVFLSNARIWIDEFDPNDLSKKLEYNEYSKRSDTVRAKNWAALLKCLLSPFT
jgi:CheY-like chemotaxis protein